MKALVAATLIVALDSFNFVSAVASVVSHTSEPLGLTLWGLALFAVAGSLKRRPPAMQPAAKLGSDRPWVNGMLPNDGQTRSAQA